jgi:hypothetical protein
LDFGGAAHRVDDAWEFDERTITCRFYNTAVMLVNFWVDKPPSMRFAALERAFLVR